MIGSDWLHIRQIEAANAGWWALFEEADETDRVNPVAVWALVRIREKGDTGEEFVSGLIPCADQFGPPEEINSFLGYWYWPFDVPTRADTEAEILRRVALRDEARGAA